MMGNTWVANIWREKFQVWWFDEPVAINEDIGYTFTEFHNEDDVLIMWTGFVDENGRKIMDGDVVQVDKGNTYLQQTVAMIGWDQNYGAWVFKYPWDRYYNYDADFLKAGKTLKKSTGTPYFLSGKFIVIIGNIFEGNL